MGQVQNGKLIIGKKHNQRGTTDLSSDSSSDSSSARETILNYKIERGECSLRKDITKGSVAQVVGGEDRNGPIQTLESPIVAHLEVVEQSQDKTNLDAEKGGNQIGPVIGICSPLDSPIPLLGNLEEIKNTALRQEGRGERASLNAHDLGNPSSCTPLESPLLAHLNVLEQAFVKANLGIQKEIQSAKEWLISKGAAKGLLETETGMSDGKKVAESGVETILDGIVEEEQDEEAPILMKSGRKKGNKICYSTKKHGMNTRNSKSDEGVKDPEGRDTEVMVLSSTNSLNSDEEVAKFIETSIAMGVDFSGNVEEIAAIIAQREMEDAERRKAKNGK
ncbi:hypothetical protein LWI29_020029 [Acer saccharum]|uniref:Uncharacterized protein n=1 Tax=Acer saccharum TaxID=4024 RepID=A0AA39VBY5_ACESA|nr:hypothetical protein LWI29_020029 [Acer saccharum]